MFELCGSWQGKKILVYASGVFHTTYHVYIRVEYVGQVYLARSELNSI